MAPLVLRHAQHERGDCIRSPPAFAEAGSELVEGRADSPHARESGRPLYRLRPRATVLADGHLQPSLRPIRLRSGRLSRNPERQRGGFGLRRAASRNSVEWMPAFAGIGKPWLRPCFDTLSANGSITPPARPEPVEGQERAGWWRPISPEAGLPPLEVYGNAPVGLPKAATRPLGGSPSQSRLLCPPSPPWCSASWCRRFRPPRTPRSGCTSIRPSSSRRSSHTR